MSRQAAGQAPQLRLQVRPGQNGQAGHAERLLLLPEIASGCLSTLPIPPIPKDLLNEPSNLVTLFSFQRRELTSSPVLVVDSDSFPPLPVDVTNQMSLFFARATPLLDEISRSACALAASDAALAANLTQALALMARICARTLRLRLAEEETLAFVARVMVSAVILFDHVHPEGAFVKSKTTYSWSRQVTSGHSLAQARRWTSRAACAH